MKLKKGLFLISICLLTLTACSNTQTAGGEDDSETEKLTANVIDLDYDSEQNTANTKGKCVEVSGFSDTELQDKVNTVLKQDATAIMDYYETFDANTTFDMEVEYKFLSSNSRLLAFYTCDYYMADSPSPNRVFAVSDVDLTTGTRRDLSKTINPEYLAKKIKKEQYIFKETDSELLEAQTEHLNSLTTEELLNQLSSYNFTVSGSKVTMPSTGTFIYETDGYINISFTTYNAIGDFMQISIETP